MSWKCSNCGSSGQPNPKGVLGFVMLGECVNCMKLNIPTIRIGNTDLGLALKDIRLAKGLTLRDVEDNIKISNGYLSQVETGKVKDIGFKKLVMLCNFYGVDIKYFTQFV